MSGTQNSVSSFIKEITKKMNWQATDWKNTYRKVPGKVSIFRIHGELPQLNDQKTDQNHEQKT